MTYAIVPTVDMTPRLLYKARVQSLDQARRSADGSKVVVTMTEDNQYHFEKYPKYTLDEIRIEMDKTEWTGESWWTNLFG